MFRVSQLTRRVVSRRTFVYTRTFSSVKGTEKKAEETTPVEKAEEKVPVDEPVVKAESKPEPVKEEKEAEAIPTETTEEKSEPEGNIDTLFLTFMTFSSSVNTEEPHMYIYIYIYILWSFLYSLLFSRYCILVQETATSGFGTRLGAFLVGVALTAGFGYYQLNTAIWMAGEAVERQVPTDINKYIYHSCSLVL